MMIQSTTIRLSHKSKRKINTTQYGIKTYKYFVLDLFLCSYILLLSVVTCENYFIIILHIFTWCHQFITPVIHFCVVNRYDLKRDWERITQIAFIYLFSTKIPWILFIYVYCNKKYLVYIQTKVKTLQRFWFLLAGSHFTKRSYISTNSLQTNTWKKRPWIGKILCLTKAATAYTHVAYGTLVVQYKYLLKCI